MVCNGMLILYLLSLILAANGTASSVFFEFMLTKQSYAESLSFSFSKFRMLMGECLSSGELIQKVILYFLMMSILSKRGVGDHLHRFLEVRSREEFRATVLC